MLTRDRIKTSECLKRPRETNDFGICPERAEQKGRKEEAGDGVSALLMWEVTFQRSLSSHNTPTLSLLLLLLLPSLLLSFLSSATETNPLCQRPITNLINSSRVQSARSPAAVLSVTPPSPHSRAPAAPRVTTLKSGPPLLARPLGGSWRSGEWS